MVQAVNFVTQYDVEVYQRIEKMQGQKLARFPAEEADVMLLQARLSPSPPSHVPPSLALALLQARHTFPHPLISSSRH